MNIKKIENRNSSLDIVRIVAVFTVVCVHFFHHNYFYNESITGYGPIEGIVKYFTTHNISDLHGPIMYIMVLMRTLFGVCVPLFMILTGWLMSGKELSRKYYKGIRKTLIIFVLASIVCMAFKSVFTVHAAKMALRAGDFGRMFEAIAADKGFDLKHYVLSIFDFTGANYSWYIEMYIGLFLMAPFLNLAYNKLKTKRHKQVLLATFLFLAVIPTAINIFNFDSATWWVNPTENDTFQKLIPAWWVGIYPIAYYFTGMYLREYGLKLKTRSVALAFVASLLLFSVFNIFRSYGTGFKTSTYGYWNGFHPYVLSVLLFVMLSRIKSDGWKPKTKTILMQISDLALGAYLMSFISDELIYERLRSAVPVFIERLPYFFITVPLSFILAMAMSFILNLLEKLIVKAYEKIKAFVIAQRAREDKHKWQHILFLVLLTGSVIFALWKCSYGYGGNDESFYLTIPHRLTMGDAMFADEWHLSQLSGFLLMPFTWLYTTIAGTTEGIILAARIVYVFVHAAATILIYVKLEKYGYFAVFGSILYFIFTPYDIMALSYDSMGLELVALTGVLIATANYDKKLQIIFSGVTFAGAVLCNPYLLSGYVIFALCMGVHLLIRKKDINFVLKSRMFAPKTFLWFTAGAAALAAVFFIFTLTRVSIADIFKNLPYMMKDPEHPSIPIMTKIGSYFTAIYKCHDLFKYLLYAYGVTAIVMVIDRKRRSRRSIYLIVSIGISVCSLLLFLPNLHTTTYNSIMFPMMFVTVTSYILCKNKPRELFAGLFCLGVLYSICIHCTSNQYFYIISTALTASNLAGFIFLGQLIREMKEEPDTVTYGVWMTRAGFVCAALLIVLQGGFQISAKAHHVFWDAETSELTEQIQQGPAKGIYTTGVNSASYNEIYNDLQVYKDKEKGNILFMTEKTFTYLAADFPYGTYSAWLSGENDNTVKRLKEFYSLNPEKTPQYVYIPKNSKWNIDAILKEAQNNGYAVKTTNVSYQLEKIN